MLSRILFSATVYAVAIIMCNNYNTILGDSHLIIYCIIIKL